MSNFIEDIEQQYEAYCKIAEDYEFIDFNAKKSGFRCTTKSNEFNAGWIAFTGALAFVSEYRQAEIDHLNSVLDERTKEWLKAIELGDYFKSVAKPLKAELDQLQSQINDMAEVGLNQEKVLMVKNKQIELVKEVLQGLKDELGDLVEMDLYDKGYRVCSKYVIDDLEQALGGAQ